MTLIILKNSIKLFFLVLMLFLPACFPQISKHAGLSDSRSTDSKNILDPNKIVADDKTTTCASFESKEDCLNAGKSHGLVCDFTVICIPRIYNENLGMKKERIEEMTSAYFEKNNSPEKMSVRKYNLVKKRYELYVLLTNLDNKKDEVYTPVKAYLEKEYFSINQKIKDLDNAAKEQKKIAEERLIQRLKDITHNISNASPDDLNQLMLDVKDGKTDISDYRLLLEGTSKQLIEGLLVRANDLNIKVPSGFTSKIVDDVLDFYNGGSAVAKWKHILDDTSLKTAENKSKELIESLFCSDDELIQNEIKNLFLYSDSQSKNHHDNSSKIRDSFIQKLRKIAEINAVMRKILIKFVSKSDENFKSELSKFVNEEPDIINSDDKAFVGLLLLEAGKL